MCRVDQEAGPDAITQARINRRAHLDFIDGPPTAPPQSGDHSRLPLEKPLEYWCHLITVKRFEWHRSFRTYPRGWFQNPREKTTPEIGTIRRARRLPARAGIGNHLLPDGEIGIGTHVQVLNALCNRPGSRRRLDRTLRSRRSNQLLEVLANDGELAFQFVERLCPRSSTALRLCKDRISCKSSSCTRITSYTRTSS